MLDDLSIHIGYVERAIGRVGELHRTKPNICRGQELHFFLIRRTFGKESDAVSAHLLSVYQVAATIGDEGVSEIFFRPAVAAKNRNASGRSEIPRGPPATFDQAGHYASHAPFGPNHPPLFLRTDAVHLSGGPIRRDIYQRGWHVVKAVPLAIARVVHESLDMMRVAADEPAPAIVEAHAVLAAAGLGFHEHRLWVETKIAPVQVE